MRVTKNAFYVLGGAIFSAILVTIGLTIFGDASMRSEYIQILEDEGAYALEICAIVFSWLIVVLAVATIFFNNKKLRTILFSIILSVHVLVFIFGIVGEVTGWWSDLIGVILLVIALVASVTFDSVWFGLERKADIHRPETSEEKVPSKIVKSKPQKVKNEPVEYTKTQEELELERKIRIAKLKKELYEIESSSKQNK